MGMTEDNATHHGDAVFKDIGNTVFKDCTLERFDGTIVRLDNTDDETINPEVYRVEDGHTYEVSPWPSMEGKCHLCGHPETIHMQATS